jgi:hypothetical protein
MRRSTKLLINLGTDIIVEISWKQDNQEWLTCTVATRELVEAAGIEPA